MITRDQIRAARALLDWGQPRLAELAEVSTDLISKIENGITDGSVKTLNRLQAILESHGVEFTEHDGIRRQAGLVKTYKSREGFINFMWGVYETLKNNGGEVCVSNVDEGLFTYWMGKEEDTRHTEEMSKLDNFRMKVLTKEGDNNLSSSNYAEYKWVHEEEFFNVPFYLYGTKLALIIFQKQDVTVVEINSREAAEAYRINFDSAWQKAKEPW